MSRVRILNLPNDCTEQALRQHILRNLPPSAPHIDITDVAIIRSRSSNNNDDNKQRNKHKHMTSSTTAAAAANSTTHAVGRSGSRAAVSATPSGRIRMAFVGLHTVAAAQFVVKHYNHTYFRSSKMVVEVAKAVGEVGVTANQRARNAHHATTIATTATTAATAATAAAAGATASRKRTRSTDDAGEATATATETNATTTTTTTSASSTASTTAATASSSSSTTHKDLFIHERARATSGPSWAAEVLLPQTTTTAATVAADDDDDVATPHDNAARAHDDNNDDDDEEQAAVQQQQQALGEMSDLDFLATLSKDANTTTNVDDNNDKDDKDNNNTCDDKQYDKHDNDKQHDDDDVALARASRRVRLAGIPYIATEAHVKQFVASLVGPVDEVHIPLTRDTRQSKGAAFVRFTHADDAVAALQRCRHAIFMGRVLRVSAAAEDPYSRRALERDAQASTTAASGGDTTAAAVVGMAGSSQYKMNKQKQLREQQAAAHRHTTTSAAAGAAAPASAAAAVVSWNAMYVNSHAAVTAVAQRIGVTAEDVVSVRARGAAVRAAIAEAYLTTEVQQVLGDEGVDMAALQEAQHNLLRPRSNTTILVKNVHLRSADEAAALTRLFVRYGTIESAAFPASGVLALVRYTHAQDARIAFARLSLKLFQGSPLYLEWAPMGACVDVDDDDNNHDSHKKKDETKDADANATKSNADEQHSHTRHGGDDAASHDANGDSTHKAQTASSSSSPSPSTSAAAIVYTLFITNIPFGTTAEAFRHFVLDACPRLARAPETLLTRLVLDADKGRAFVSVRDARTLAYCKAKLHGRTFDKRVLSCETSKQTLAALEAAKRVASSLTTTSAADHTKSSSNKADVDSDDDDGSMPTALAHVRSHHTNDNNNNDDDDDAALSKARAAVVAPGVDGSSSSSAAHSLAAPVAAAAAVPPDADACKLIVKNLPFEATERDVRELFSAFSEVRSVRVPRKTHAFSSHRSNNHRGFAFVEFLSAAEAARAMRSLRATHLYGRHLVLEYAKRDA